ncbi:MAG: hypothetical protein WKG32_17335 [Gemmatimonadaceae bacterium]
MATHDTHDKGDPRDSDRTPLDRDERDIPAEDLSAPGGKKNPPRTTTGKVTSPKFGSAGSGGAELEPGPEKN